MDRDNDEDIVRQDPIAGKGNKKPPPPPPLPYFEAMNTYDGPSGPNIPPTIYRESPLVYPEMNADVSIERSPSPSFR